MTTLLMKGLPNPMHPLTAPLQSLHPSLSWFIRNKELRLLHILTSPDFRPTVLKRVVLLEGHAENSSPFILLEDPFTARDEGWLSRLARARALHQQRREAMEREGLLLLELPPAPAGDEPLQAFSLQLLQLLWATRVPPLEGLIVVLAPTRLEASSRFAAQLEQLVTSPALLAVRWILLDVDAISVAPLLEALGAGALQTTCRPDASALSLELDRIANALASASPPGPARLGAAWPKETPPPRPCERQQPPSPLEPLSAAQRLPPLLLRAAQAAGKNNLPLAIALQHSALELCMKEQSLARESILSEMTLASYYLMNDERPLAKAAYRQAAERATRLERYELAAQATLGVGTLHLLDGQLEQAVACFLETARAADLAKLPALSLEGYRLAGQTCVDARDLGRATLYWEDAMNLARGLKVVELRGSGAQEVARALLALYQQQGRTAEAMMLAQEMANWARESAP